nr:GatB/YqeY domain-containing protein [Anaerolineae bacterium]
MNLSDRLSADLKDAMKSGDDTRKMVIRDVRSAIKEAEQRNRETLVKQALKKHGVERPRSDSPADLAAYNRAVEDTLATERVEELSKLPDPDILAVIQKLSKQRQETIADAQKADREDLVQAAQEEFDILAEYLPKQLSREEIEAVAREVIAETGASSMREMGQVMGPIMERLQGKADGKLVSEVVRSLLS